MDQKFQIGKKYTSGAVYDGKIVDVEFECIGFDENGIAKFNTRIKEGA